ncbi:MAG: response regulator transcription factor, partial [Christensenellaceae bacterium]|nr:response regulator transcription factor [Christensenellaceae bacterium]
IDGFELMEYIAPLKIPTIFLTARTGLGDRVKGLQMGGDDYIAKPFDIAELLARVEAVLRRYRKTDPILRVGDVLIDTDSYSVTKAGAEVELTLKEFELLVLLVQNQNTALFRETIFRRIWKSEYIVGSRTLDLHIQRLRKKLDWHDRIKTVYKVGYRLENPT